MYLGVMVKNFMYSVFSNFCLRATFIPLCTSLRVIGATVLRLYRLQFKDLNHPGALAGLSPERAKQMRRPFESLRDRLRESRLRRETALREPQGPPLTS